MVPSTTQAKNAGISTLGPSSSEGGEETFSTRRGVGSAGDAADSRRSVRRSDRSSCCFLGSFFLPTTKQSAIGATPALPVSLVRTIGGEDPLAHVSFFGTANHIRCFQMILQRAGKVQPQLAIEIQAIYQPGIFIIRQLSGQTQFFLQLRSRQIRTQWKIAYAMCRLLCEIRQRHRGIRHGMLE